MHDLDLEFVWRSGKESSVCGFFRPFLEKCFWAYSALIFILPSLLSNVVFGLKKLALVHCICPDMNMGKFFYFSQTLSGGLL